MKKRKFIKWRNESGLPVSEDFMAHYLSGTTCWTAGSKDDLWDRKPVIVKEPKSNTYDVHSSGRDFENLRHRNEQGLAESPTLVKKCKTLKEAKILLLMMF